MNIGTIICLILALLFSVLSGIFALLKEKGAILISGFNSLSKAEREQYDQKKMSIDMRNSLFIWAIVLFLGAVSSNYISKYCSIIALVIWLIMFLKDVHMDMKIAFEKYRKLE